MLIVVSSDITWYST